jgi:hypothetical protein
MAKGKRGIGLNKPCIKCGAEVPHLFVSPVQPGLCGKCTDEAIKTKKKTSQPIVREIILEKAHMVRALIFLALGLMGGFALALLIAGAAPSTWASLLGPVQKIFG